MGEELSRRLDRVVLEVMDDDIHEPPGAISDHNLPTRVWMLAPEGAPYNRIWRHEWCFVASIEVRQHLFTLAWIPVMLDVQMGIEWLGIVGPKLQRNPPLGAPAVDP
jgi:hypothetical protein